MHNESHERLADNERRLDRSDLWQLYQYRTRYSPLPLVVTEGPEHLVRYANPAFCELAQKKPEDIRGLPFGTAVPEDEGNGCLELLDRVFTTRIHGTLSDQIHMQGDDTSRRWDYAVWSLGDEWEASPGLMICISDTSAAWHSREMALELSEALLLFSLEQIERTEAAELSQSRLRLAVQETEHRAKNSLQTIGAALGILLRNNPESVPKIELTKLQLHIRTIGTMHKLLTFIDPNSTNIGGVPVNHMLQELLPMWQSIVGTGRFQWMCETIEMPIKDCTSLVTVINELVCNSVKHGAKTVTLKISKVASNISLEVSDDGPGFPEDFKPADSSSFGLRFVESVVRSELKGRTSYESLSAGGGALVTILFPMKAQTEIPPVTF